MVITNFSERQLDWVSLDGCYMKITRGYIKPGHLGVEAEMKISVQYSTPPPPYSLERFFLF